MSRGAANLELRLETRARRKKGGLNERLEGIDESHEEATSSSLVWRATRSESRVPKGN